MVDKNFWKQALSKAEAERATLLEERQQVQRDQEGLEARSKEIDQQIAQLEQTMATIGPLARTKAPGLDPAITAMMNDIFGNLDLDETSLANSCREVLKASNTFMTPVKIKEALINAGYDEGKHSNLGASVHSVLKRLEQAGDVIRATDSYENSVYKWNTSAFKHSPLKHRGQRPAWQQELNKAKKKS